MIRRSAVSVATLAVFFVGCGGKIASDSGSTDTSNPGSTTTSGLPTDGSCPTTTGGRYCPDDEPITADDIEQCKQGLADPTCGASYESFLACAESHVSCTTSGTTDGDVIDSACNSQLQTYEACAEGQSHAHP
jgi:hypothetical protein